MKKLEQEIKILERDLDRSTVTEEAMLNRLKETLNRYGESDDDSKNLILERILYEASEYRNQTIESDLILRDLDNCNNKVKILTKIKKFLGIRA